MRYVVAFGRFWYDFLVGDRPELFIGPVVALVLVAAMLRLGWSAIGGAALVILIVASGAWALVREVAGARRSG